MPASGHSRRVVPAARARRARRTLPPAVTLALALIASLSSLYGCGSSAPSASSPAALVSIGAGLKGPAGLHASVYAHGPLTTAAATFDSDGRLWLAAAGLEAHAHDGVYLVAKAGAPVVKVIGGLVEPLGMLWYGNRLYVASLGRVDAYGAFNGSRFATHARILNGPVADGENNLLALAPNGRILMGVTATCDHCTPTSRYSGAIVSFQPDGSNLQVYASRIRAPVGLSFLPGSSDLFVTMNQRDDLGARTPGDWLALVGEGQDWGFPGCYGQGGPACAGVPKPIAALDAHAAVGGIAILTGQLGADVGTAAIVAEWNSEKVQQVTLAKGGSGYTGTVAPFLTGIKKPLAVALAPGRTLLVGDWETGTLYRISRA